MGKVGKRLQTEAERAAQLAPLWDRGRPKNGEEKGVMHTLNRGTGTTDYELARLKRDARTDPDKARLLREVQDGTRTGREDLEEWGSSARVELETIRATIDAYGRGEIELPLVPKKTREDHIR